MSEPMRPGDRVLAGAIVFWPGFTKLTRPVKPPTSGSVLPDWFDRKPVKTG